MSTTNTPPNPPDRSAGSYPEPWMCWAAFEIYTEMGIKPFDQAVDVIAAIIGKHYGSRETKTDWGRQRMAELEKWVAEQKAGLTPEHRVWMEEQLRKSRTMQGDDREG